MIQRVSRWTRNLALAAALSLTALAGCKKEQPLPVQTCKVVAEVPIYSVVVQRGSHYLAPYDNLSFPNEVRGKEVPVGYATMPNACDIAAVEMPVDDQGIFLYLNNDGELINSGPNHTSFQADGINRKFFHPGRKVLAWTHQPEGGGEEVGTLRIESEPYQFVILRTYNRRHVREYVPPFDTEPIFTDKGRFSRLYPKRLNIYLTAKYHDDGR